MWSARPDFDVWATGGYGRGDLQVEEAGFGRQDADTDWRTGAIGGKLQLPFENDLIEGGKTTLSSIADAYATRFEVSDNGELIEDLGVDAQRLRLGIVAEHDRKLESGARFSPTLELAGRHDAGDGETGTGLEIGSKVRYLSADGRLSIHGGAHSLLAFTGSKDEWGVGAGIQFNAEKSGKGLWVRVQPSYGADATGIQGMWDRHPGSGMAATPRTGARMDANVGYGIANMRGGLLTVHGGQSRQAEGLRQHMVGAMFEYKDIRVGLNLELMETGYAGTSTGIKLEGSIPFGG